MDGLISSKNGTTNGTGGDLIGNLVLLNLVVTPLYVLFILLPSLLLNGFVVAIFVKKKDIRSPLTLLTVNQCCAGIFSNFLNGFLLLVATPIALKYGSCATGPLLLATSLWTHYGMNALNLAAISIGIFVTLKYGSAIITYKKVQFVIAVNWVYPAIWAVMLAFIAKDYPSLTCAAYTDFELPASNSSFGPHVYQIIPFVARDLLIDMVTRVLVATFCIGSYKLFRRDTINPPEGLTRKMLLLPILMTVLLTAITLCTGVLLIGLNNGYGVTIGADSPIVYIKDIALLLVEYDAIVYASLLIYLNTKIQDAFKEVFKDIFNQLQCVHVHNCLKCLNAKRNKVSPVGFPIPSTECTITV